MPRFPQPYLNETMLNDPMMERIPLPTTSIGSTPAGLPKGGIGADMNIEHVGGGLGQKQGGK